MGYLIGLTVFFAWLTHIFTCFAQGLWGFLVAGAILFPIGILHGFYLWFKYGNNMEFDNTNRAVLFKNENKKTDTHPDYSGNLNFEGVECFLDAWIKTAESGRKFMSLSVKRKDKQAAQEPSANRPAQPAQRQQAPAPRQAAPRPASGFDDMDDDIPF